MKTESFRLSSTICPVNYDLFFEVDLTKFEFHGKESIDLEISKPASKIVLNARDLAITHVYLIHHKKSITPKVKIDNEKELVTLTLGENVKGSVKLCLDFDGKLTDNLVGFYRSKYLQNKSEKYLATTQFEAPYARRAFPCFDDPEFKATFDVSLSIDKKFQGISNMPIKQSTTDKGKKIVKFQRTPKMSTYLLYMGVGEFEFLESKMKNVLVRIVTTPGKKKQGELALEMTKNILSYFEDYSQIKYPLPKLDVIALPDFAWGAMENWGAITFRELYLLFDPKMTSTAVKKRIAMIIAHELWHQWSGDLVTMRWWNDLWLNESFATFMGYKAVDHFYPEWKMWEEFIDDETERAFGDDSLKTTHPIEVDVRDPHEIEEIFDAISYSKGGSILRMLESFLGDEVFRKGVSDYLNANKYGNATSEDLWKSLAKISQKPVKEIMIDWIRQPGYPLVEAVLENQHLLLRQKKFVFNQNDAKTTWKIPLTIKLSNNSVMNYILDKRENQVPIEAALEWFKVNHNQSGFYRVKYPNGMMQKFDYLVGSKSLESIDRWSVQNDLFELSRHGEDNLDNYLRLIKSYGNEDSHLVLSSIYTNLRSIYFVFNQEKFWSHIWPSFKNHFTEAPRRMLEKLGWEPKPNESQEDALLRESAIRFLGFAEDPDVISKVRELYQNYLKTKSLHPDIKSPVFFITALNGDEKTYKELLNLYSTTESPEEKRIFLAALGQFKSVELIKKYLDFSLTSKVRTQDLIISFSSVASNPHSRQIFLQWVKKNWSKIKKYEKSGKILVTFLESFIAANVNEDAVKELKDFFKKNPIKYKLTLDRSFEKVERNLNWLENNKENLEKYFS